MFKGQEMAVFKILIGAVFAVALLAIVYSALTNVGCPYSAFDEVRNLVLQASRAPNKCFQRESVCFEKGTVISSVSLKENLLGISSLSVSSVSASSLVSCAGNQCIFEKKASIPVSAKCSSTVSCAVVINSLSC
ncbi:MAG: hypothetical protein QXO69_03060 [archaeon]